MPSIDVTLTGTVIDPPSATGISADAEPEFTLTEFTVTAAALWVAVGVNATEATLLSMANVYDTVPDVNVGDKVPEDTPRLVNVDTDDSRVTTTVYVPVDPS